MWLHWVHARDECSVWRGDPAPPTPPPPPGVSLSAPLGLTNQGPGWSDPDERAEEGI